MSEIQGNGAPSKHLVANIGDIYTDIDTGDKYECLNIYTITGHKTSETIYEWELITTKNSGGSSGSATQPDWNQNDETSSDYVKNRTHYDSREITEIVNGAYEFKYAEDTGYYGNILTLPIDHEFTEGEKVTVVWDGTTYNLVVRVLYIEHSEFTLSIPYIGNGSYLADIYTRVGYPCSAEDTGEPFVLISSSIYTKSTEAEHTISISLIEGELHPLDEKYLPDTVVTKDYLQNQLGVIENGTY